MIWVGRPGIHGPGIQTIGAGVRRAAGAGVPVEFLLRDDFLTDEDAPLESPRTAEPGPGTLTIVDTEDSFSISGGEVVPSAQSASNGNPGIHHAAGFSRETGRNFYARVKKVTTFGGTGTSPKIGWSTASGGTSLNSLGGYLYTSVGVNPVPFSTTTIGEETLDNLDAFKDFHSILRSSGMFLVVDNKLLWVLTENNSATMYPQVFSVSENRMPPGIETMRVADLPAPWNTDFGIATDHLPGARTAGDTFTHEADAIIEWVQTTLPSAGFTNFWFRQSGANNAWIAQINSAGNIALFEHVAGVSTLRGSASGVVSNGHRIVVIADGEMIRGYSNNVLRWTYSSAANFKTETDGRLQPLGTGGAVSDVISWPRTLSGAAKSALDKVVNAL